MAWEDPDERPPPVLPPAPLQPRIVAAVLDGVVLVLVSFAFFLFAMWLGGHVVPTVPTWAALAAPLGYAVVPLLAFQATLFMRLFRLELIGRDGRVPDPITWYSGRSSVAGWDRRPTSSPSCLP